MKRIKLRNLIAAASAIALFFTVSCSKKTQTGFITGQLENSDGKVLILEQLTASDVVPKDSINISEDGSFAFDLKNPKTGFYRLKTDKSNYIILVLDSNDKASVTGDANDLVNTYDVKGSEQSAHLRDLNRELKKFATKIDSLESLYESSQEDTAFATIAKRLEAAYDSVMEEQRLEVKGFIDQHPASLANLAAVENLDLDKDFEYFIKVENELMRLYPELEYVRSFSLRISDSKKLSIGAVAPDFTLKTPDGKDVSLSSFKGKYVMIDFWASWCKPCRQENPNVVRVYSKFNPKGFEILGVSLDQKKDEWVEAIKEDKLSWTHVSDLGFWNSVVVKLYDIKGIPQTYLIDKEGKIAAKGLRGEQLEKKLIEIYGL